MSEVTKKTKKASPLLNEDTSANDNSVDNTDTKPEVATSKKEVAPEAKTNIASEMKSDIEVTRANLAKEEQVHFMIPLGIGEKAGAVEEVWINGYYSKIPKGVMTIVPKSIMQILANKYQVANEAGAEFRLDLHPEKDAGNN